MTRNLEHSDILQTPARDTTCLENNREEIVEDLSFLHQAVDVLERAGDTIAAVRDLVMQNGGHWNDALARDSHVLFEIHLFGVAGVGLGAEGAAQNWLKNARAELNAPAETA